MRRFLCLLCSFAIIQLIFSLSVEIPEKMEKTCTTELCYKVASEILQNRNVSVNPCENLYDYACGRWNKYNVIPNYTLIWSQKQKLQRNIFREINYILSEPIRDNDSEPIVAAKLIHQSCMNEDAIEEANIDPILAILHETGGWPVTLQKDNWNANFMSWQEIDLRYITFLGRSLFYKFGFESKEKKGGENILSIEPQLDFPCIKNIKMSDIWQMNENGENATGLLKVIGTFAKRQGQKLKKSDIYIDVKQMMIFEKHLEKMIQKPKRRSRSVMTLGEFQNWISVGTLKSKTKIRFTYIFDKLFNMVNKTIKPSQKIVVYNKQYFLELIAYLEVAPTQVIVNYIQWNMVYSLLSYTTAEMWKTKRNMVLAQMNQTDIIGYKPRWLYCVKESNIKDAVSYAFVTKFTSSKVIEKTAEMVQNIQLQLKIFTANSEDLTEDIKVFMLEKLDTIKKQFGYPAWYNDTQAISEEYKGLKLGKEYFQNMLNHKKFEFMKKLKYFQVKDKLERWHLQPTEINAYYSQATHTIVIPASQMVKPVFTPWMPEAVNYGKLGVVLGHEVSHSIDRKNIHYNQYGEDLHWDDLLLETYKDKEECFVRQYSQYILSDTEEAGKQILLNGDLTLGENMADNVGIKAAYYAYKAVEKNQMYKMKLPGLEHLSGDQLFFMTFANNGCSQMRSSSVHFENKEHVHCPRYFRVIGSVSNMPEFASAFNCPKGSFMNPETKCNLFS